MRIHIILTVCIITLIALGSCKSGVKEKAGITIKRLDFLQVLDTTGSGRDLNITRVDYYLVSPGNLDSPEIRKGIEKFVGYTDSISTCPYGQCDMMFYKESDETNEVSLKANPRILDKYSQDHDLVWAYTWTNGKFAGALKYQNGLVVYPESSILIKDN